MRTIVWRPVNLKKLSSGISYALRVGTAATVAAGALIDPSYLMGTAALAGPTGIDLYFRHGQKQHAILRNFGILGSLRYILEGIGKEQRQYTIESDTEGRPFNRLERAAVYRLAKNEKIKTEPFGTQEDLEGKVMIQHSMYPKNGNGIEPYSLTFGEERGLEKSYTINNPVMISGMSFGALGENAVRALSRGAKMAGIPICTGEGGYPKYQVAEEADTIFQIGTGKFGVSNSDGTLNEEKLEKIAENPYIKMIEIKFSQGAKPGKGGMVPAEKVTEEVAALRGVAAWEDSTSPPRHVECDNAEHTVEFIKKVQDVSKLPVGMKLCLGNEDEFEEFIYDMKKQDVFPDYIALDGAEGGTGAAPISFMDDVGRPLFSALEALTDILERNEVRDKMKIVASAKLVKPGVQYKALAYGADAIYTGRGFLMALGCIQALECNSGECPAGITTHDPSLQRGLVVEEKAERVASYANNLKAGLTDLIKATGINSFKELDKKKHLYIPEAS